MDTAPVSVWGSPEHNSEQGCPGLSTLLRFAEDEGPGADRSRVRAHFGRCVACAAATALYRRECVEAPTTKARFIRTSLLGSGGMGRVYRAYDPELRRPIALKVLHEHCDADEAERLLWEAAAMARVTHDNVVQVFDVGHGDDGPYIAMQLVEGLDLSRWLAAADRSAEEIIATFVAAGQGLAAAHRAGIVHRDFKPANVLVGDDGLVRVGDFGLALPHLPTEPIPETSWGSSPPPEDPEGAAVGTPRYMSPEQHRGQPTDARTDQFSFAMALVEALTGRLPFSGPTLEAHRLRVCGGQLDRRAIDVLPRRIRGGLVRALSVNPADRFERIESLLAVLSSPRRGRARRPLAVAVVALAGLVGALAITPADARAVASSVDTQDTEPPRIQDAEQVRRESQRLLEAHRPDEVRATAEAAYFEAREAGDRKAGASAAVKLAHAAAQEMQVDEARRWTRLALAEIDAGGGGPEDRAGMLLMIAALDENEGDYEGAAAAIDEAEDAAAGRSTLLTLEIERQRAELSFVQGKTEDAVVAYTAANAHLDRVSLPECSTTIGIRFGLAQALLGSGRIGALASLRPRLAPYLDHPHYGWRFNDAMARIEIELGHGEVALEHTRTALALLERHPDMPPAPVAYVTLTWANALASAGRVEEAREILERELARDAATPVRDRQPEVRYALADLALRSGALEEAWRQLRALETTKLDRSGESVAGSTRVRMLRAKMLLAGERLEEARAELDGLQAEHEAKHGQTHHAFTLRWLWAELAAREGRWSSAAEHLDDALAWLRARGGAPHAVTALDLARERASVWAAEGIDSGTLGLIEDSLL